MKTRWLTVVMAAMALILAVTLSACGKTPSETSASTSTTGALTTTEKTNVTTPSATTPSVTTPSVTTATTTSGASTTSTGTTSTLPTTSQAPTSSTPVTTQTPTTTSPINEGSQGLFYEEVEDGYAVKGMGTCTDTAVVIPAYYEGKPVKAIAYEAFSGEKTITSLTVSAGVERIEDYAFHMCSQLQEVTLPETLLSIGDYAFCSTGLVRFTMPDSVSTMGQDAFAGCDDLKEIVLSDNLTALPLGTFRYCESLESITYGEKTDTIGRYAFAYTKMESITIPACIRVLEDGVFMNSEVKTVVFEGSVISMGVKLFEDSKIENVVLPQGLETVPERAFESCFSLTEITIPSSVKTIGKQAFAGCRALKQIHLAEGLLTIEEEAFWDSGIEEIDLPNTLKTIETRAFAYVDHLKEITLPSSLSTIGERVFEWCDGLETVYYPAGLSSVGYGLFANCNALKRLVVDEGTTEIPRGLCNGCSNLSEIVLPDSVTKVGGGAFAGSKLSLEKLPSSLSTIGNAAFSGVTVRQLVITPELVLEDGALSGVCAESLVIEAGRTAIPASAFQSLKGVTTLELPEGIETIGQNAFASSSLTTIVLPSTLKTISENAFTKSALTELILPDSVQVVGEGAFAECRSLTSVTLSESLVLLNQNAFKDCKGLKNVTMPTPVGSTKVFDGCSSIDVFRFGDTWDTFKATFGYNFLNGIGTEIICDDGTYINGYPAN